MKCTFGWRPKNGLCWVFLWNQRVSLKVLLVLLIRFFCRVRAYASVFARVRAFVFHCHVVAVQTQSGCTNVACAFLIVLLCPQAEDQMEGRDPHSSPEELMTLKNFRQVRKMTSLAV